jgi:hypothetical protein
MGFSHSILYGGLTKVKRLSIYDEKPSESLTIPSSVSLSNTLSSLLSSPSARLLLVRNFGAEGLSLNFENADAADIGLWVDLAVMFAASDLIRDRRSMHRILPTIRKRVIHFMLITHRASTSRPFPFLLCAGSATSSDSLFCFFGD